MYFKNSKIIDKNEKIIFDGYNFYDPKQAIKIPIIKITEAEIIKCPDYSNDELKLFINFKNNDYVPLVINHKDILSIEQNGKLVCNFSQFLIKINREINDRLNSKLIDPHMHSSILKHSSNLEILNTQHFLGFYFDKSILNLNFFEKAINNLQKYKNLKMIIKETELYYSKLGDILGFDIPKIDPIALIASNIELFEDKFQNERDFFIEVPLPELNRFWGNYNLYSKLHFHYFHDNISVYFCEIYYLDKNESKLSICRATKSFKKEK